MTVRITEALNRTLNKYLEMGSLSKPLSIHFSSRVARDEFVRTIEADIGMKPEDLVFDAKGRRNPPMYNGIEFRAD